MSVLVSMLISNGVGEVKFAQRSVYAVLCTALTLAGCVPIPRLSYDIDNEQLAVFEAGQTSASDVEAALGQPTLIWEDERVWVYNQGPRGSLFWLPPVPYQTQIASTDLADDLVILQFDDSDRLIRSDRRAAPAFPRDFGKFLRNWVAEDIE